jgi:hypothetical protein
MVDFELETKICKLPPRCNPFHLAPPHKLNPYGMKIISFVDFRVPCAVVPTFSYLSQKFRSQKVALRCSYYEYTIRNYQH